MGLRPNASKAAAAMIMMAKATKAARRRELIDGQA
jgi:hypothetical protein